MLIKESEIPGSDDYEQDFFIGSFKSHAGCRTVLHCVGLSPALEDVQALSAPPVKHHCPQSRRQSHTSPKDHHGVYTRYLIILSLVSSPVKWGDPARLASENCDEGWSQAGGEEPLLKHQACPEHSQFLPTL